MKSLRHVRFSNFSVSSPGFKPRSCCHIKQILKTLEIIKHGHVKSLHTRLSEGLKLSIIKTRLIFTWDCCISEQKCIAMGHKCRSGRDNYLYGTTIPVANLRTSHPQFLAFATLQRISYFHFLVIDYSTHFCSTQITESLELFKCILKSLLVRL